MLYNSYWDIESERKTTNLHLNIVCIHDSDRLYIHILSHLTNIAGADPGGGGGGVLGVRILPQHPFGGPPNFIQRDPPPPPPFRNPVSAPA